MKHKDHDIINPSTERTFSFIVNAIIIIKQFNTSTLPVVDRERSEPDPGRARAVRSEVGDAHKLPWCVDESEYKLREDTNRNAHVRKKGTVGCPGTPHTSQTRCDDTHPCDVRKVTRFGFL